MKSTEKLLATHLQNGSTDPQGGVPANRDPGKGLLPRTGLSLEEEGPLVIGREADGGF